MADTPDFIPDAQAASFGAPETIALNQPAKAPDFIPADQFSSDEDTYGTLGQQIGAGLEGVARGATLGASDILETQLGLSTPEAIKQRMIQNPATSMLGSIAGGAGLVGLTGGIAAPIEGAALGAEAIEAGETATAAATAAGSSTADALAAGRAASLAAAGPARSAAASALGYGAEGALFGAGNAISDAALGDPDLNAQKILGDIGMGALWGAGLGTIGSGLESLYKSPSVLRKPISDEINNVAESAKTAEAMAPIEQPTSAAVKAAKELNLPIPSGFGSSDPWVQKATDSLIHGAPSWAAKKVGEEYQNAYDAVSNVLDGIVGEGRYTKAEVGNNLKTSLAEQISQENAPISEMYNLIKQKTQDIPLPQGATKNLGSEILGLQETKFNTPAARLAKDVVNDLDNVKSVDDIKALTSTLNSRVAPTATSGEKYMAGLLRQKLTSLEENSIENAALKTVGSEEEANQVRGLIEQRRAANAQYKPFIEKLGTLAEQLGKRRISGPMDAAGFIEGLDPEELTQKLFSTKSSEFNDFFAKNFPEQSALLKEYVKDQIREDSISKTTNEFSPSLFLNKLKSKQFREPEIQSAIFSPDELSAIENARTYLKEGFPKNFNPSGTSGMSAFRQFVESPSGAAIGNVRDFGLLQYIRRAGQMPEGVRPDAAQLGAELAEKYNKFTATQNIIDRYSKKIFNSAKSIFDKDAVRGALIGVGTNLESYEDRAKKIKSVSQDPVTMMNHISNHIAEINETLPATSQAIATSSVKAIQYLNSKLPQEVKMPLSSPKPVSNAQKQAFNNYYETVVNPLSAMDRIKNGSLNNQNMEALNAVHPELLQNMRKAVVMNFNDAKAKNLPYTTQIALAKFMGAPLDQSMLPASIARNQMTMNAPPLSNQSQNQGKVTKGGMEKLSTSKRSATLTQELEEDAV